MKCEFQTILLQTPNSLAKRKKKTKSKLAKDEATCFACKRAGRKSNVKIVNPVNKSIPTKKRTIKAVSGKCAVCGGKVFVPNDISNSELCLKIS
jgi:hypothetical protein